LLPALLQTLLADSAFADAVDEELQTLPTLTLLPASRMERTCGGGEGGWEEQQMRRSGKEGRGRRKHTRLVVSSENDQAKSRRTDLINLNEPAEPL
jgi:hypothetical protein